MPLSNFIQDPNEVLKLQPQELAGYLIQDFKQELKHERKTFFQLVNYLLSLKTQYLNFSQPVALEEAVNEGIAWLISEALLMQDFTDTSGGFYKLTRRAQQLQEPQDINKIAKVRATLPKAFLHPTIAQYAGPSFESGQYDVAVLQAFKQVEILIRDGTGLAKLDGVDLVREAFRPANLNNNVFPGILTDVSARDNEQQGMHQLFAGAMLTFRNPSGHQNLDINPKESAELIIFASHLMGIVEARLKANGIVLTVGKAEIQKKTI